jgi:pimeloyl-ACP methyl ester carboxylesterase
VKAVGYDSKMSAEDLHLLIKRLDVGPVHLTGQDISGATVFRLATTHPEDLLSLTAIEMGLPGSGLEALADITHGGAWYIGVLAAISPDGATARVISFP